MELSHNPTDFRTAQGLAEKLEAETILAKSHTLRNYAFSGAAILGTAGLVTAACIFAWGLRGPTPEELAEALKRMPPLTVNGSVKVDPQSEVKLAKDAEVKLAPDQTVTLAKGAEVRLADGSTVRLAEGATVNVDGKVGVDSPPVRLPDMTGVPQKTRDGDVIKQKVTVFHQVIYAQGEVTTGWEYADGATKWPHNTYCYYIEATRDGSERRINLAYNGAPHNPSKRLMADFDTALSKCVSYNGSRDGATYQ